MPMSVCLFVCVCVCVFVRVFAKFQKCNISAISQPIIMKLGIHITYGYTVTDKYFQNFAKTRTNKQTNTQTDRQTDMGITIPRPPPMGAR